MLRTVVLSEVKECRDVWRQHYPREQLTDLWEVRACFHRHFRRPLQFVVAMEGTATVGLLPLVQQEEEGRLVYFPGETWRGRTWLEQNRLIARDRQVLDALLREATGAGQVLDLRYLLPDEPLAADHHLDEVGYLFVPSEHGYDFDRYMTRFSGRSRKRLGRELAGFEAARPVFRLDEAGDLEEMVRLNLARFGADSYFADRLFLAGFMDLAALLRARGWLRVTTVLLDGEVAAVDVGCVYRRQYTLLAGGTASRFPGVAKLINLHHIRRACEEHLELVDFLCGEFAWKPMFHLSPRPLYQLADVGFPVPIPDATSLWSEVAP